MEPETREVDTPLGPARSHLHRPESDPTALLLLTHGAGGGITAPDLHAATTAALTQGCAVALVEQPYRVAGRKLPGPIAQADVAWVALAEALHDGEFKDLPLVTGGRSFGARVACRTSTETGSAGVLCLAFPTHPPGKPEKTRQPELDAVAVPTLIIQGTSDPFGTPTPPPGGRLVTVAGDHSLKKDHATIRTAVADWLQSLLR
ncbi:alpha/beta hydrolase [Tessaracoccus terricola]